MLQDGDIAPDFALPTDAGGTFKLSGLRGKPVVVYFYPKDDTSGCTIEAKDFWEVIDRGTNFDYLDSERKQKLKIFFSWFPSLSDERSISNASS